MIDWVVKSDFLLTMTYKFAVNSSYLRKQVSSVFLCEPKLLPNKISSKFNKSWHCIPHRPKRNSSANTPLETPVPPNKVERYSSYNKKYLPFQMGLPAPLKLPLRPCCVYHIFHQRIITTLQWEVVACQVLWSSFTYKMAAKSMIGVDHA